VLEEEENQMFQWTDDQKRVYGKYKYLLAYCKESDHSRYKTYFINISGAPIVGMDLSKGGFATFDDVPAMFEPQYEHFGSMKEYDYVYIPEWEDPDGEGIAQYTFKLQLKDGEKEVVFVIGHDWHGLINSMNVPVVNQHGRVATWPDTINTKYSLLNETDYSPGPTMICCAMCECWQGKRQINSDGTKTKVLGDGGYGANEKGNCLLLTDDHEARWHCEQFTKWSVLKPVVPSRGAYE
jgi:hypothetical protein